MTAEVALLNREAVALAADSAVSLMGYDQPKIYNSANKIFTLSPTEPVAVMVFNSGALGSVPWETIIKEYRREYGSKPRGTIDKYSKRLLKYLVPFLKKHAPQSHISHTIRVVNLELQKLWSEVVNSAGEAFLEGAKVSLDAAEYVIEVLIDGRLEQFQLEESMIDMSQMEAEKQIIGAIPQLDDYIKEQFEGVELSDHTLDKIKAILQSALRSGSAQDWSSGLVVTGFGRDEVLPSLVHHQICGLGQNKVYFKTIEEIRIDEDNPASIQPFAQTDMISSFMNGLDPRMYTAVHSTVNRIFGKLIDRINSLLDSNDNRSDQSGEHLSASRDEFMKLFESEVQQHMIYQSYLPIMNVVAALPKEELADLAEALVNITSVRRRVTPVAETVGGPCDVAVISKGDGFVWIKRKHYFTPELNPRYFRRDEKI